MRGFVSGVLFISAAAAAAMPETAMAGPPVVDSERTAGAGASGREGGGPTSPQATRDVKVNARQHIL